MKHDRFLKTKRLLCMALIVLCAFVFSSCTAPAAVPAQRERAQSSRFPLSCLIEQFTSEQPETDSEWFQAFSERYQVDISLTSIPTLDFVDRLSYLLTTDELPALIMTNNKLTQTGVLNRAVDAGAFWNLDDYIQDYPDLMAYFGTEALNNAKINGKLYGLPRLRPLGRNGILFRKDWVENLGLAEPKTIEDLYEMIRAFQQDDPDGNGKQDTRGLVNCWKSWAACRCRPISRRSWPTASATRPCIPARQAQRPRPRRGCTLPRSCWKRSRPRALNSALSPCMSGSVPSARSKRRSWRTTRCIRNTA